MTFSLFLFYHCTCYTPLQPVLISFSFFLKAVVFDLVQYQNDLWCHCSLLPTSLSNYGRQYAEIKAQHYYVSNNPFSFFPLSLQFPSFFNKNTSQKQTLQPGNDFHDFTLPVYTRAPYNIFLRKLLEMICHVEH